MKSNGLTYRKIQREDIKPIFGLGRKHFGSPQQYSWDWSKAKIESYLDETFGSGVICTSGKKLVGFALAQNKYSEQKPNVAWFTYVMVDPEHQGRGIGKDLTAKVTEALKAKGVTEVITDVYENNAESLKFFEKQGFDIKERWFILARQI